MADIDMEGIDVEIASLAQNTLNCLDLKHVDLGDESDPVNFPILGDGDENDDENDEDKQHNFTCTFK